MRAFRIIPTDRDHPKDLDPTYMGIPSGTGKATLMSLM
jgi:hypothetical protein